MLLTTPAIAPLINDLVPAVSPQFLILLNRNETMALPYAPRILLMIPRFPALFLATSPTIVRSPPITIN